MGVRITVFNANSEDHGQTPRSATSDLGLQCLPVTILGISKLNG